ncbi:hypothetical protein Ccrd_020751 [Cynara cardunculus var. scolymus]|uniref:Uncharacterized protein n=1 Tax=Cynara cardunculus var. scolymus TaxID=59895 RepID=A0A103Y1W1_CYNCS|nr:hypothetical protein Ccrd_020751 [Cynara cardunculus var. scolymus]
MTMAISPSLLPALLLFYLLTICKSMALISQFSSTGGDDHSHLIDEIREAELNVVRLETILEESISIVDSKNLYIKESEKLVEEMTSEVDHLQSVLLTMKNYSSSANERLNRLKKEVQLLGAAARRNTFELHILESKAQDAESRLEITKSRVEMLQPNEDELSYENFAIRTSTEMASIVTEQWIQIQHLEQALEIAKRNSKEIKKQLSSIRCSFLKSGAAMVHCKSVAEPLHCSGFGNSSSGKGGIRSNHLPCFEPGGVSIEQFLLVKVPWNPHRPPVARYYFRGV